MAKENTEVTQTTETTEEKKMPSKATVIRTAVLVLAIINNALAIFGKSPLPIDSDTLTEVISFGFTTVAAFVTWWYNNSFTQKAIKADRDASKRPACFYESEGTEMTKQEFINQIARYVQKYAPQYGIKCNSAVIAQAILESGWGESKLASQYHNYFGLKCGTKWTGPSVNMTTMEEYQPGTLTEIKDNFRAYSSMEEGVKGYFEFIQLERYQNLKGITDPQTYLQTIRNDGYATSITYVENTMALVNQYNLTQYDGKG